VLIRLPLLPLFVQPGLLLRLQPLMILFVQPGLLLHLIILLETCDLFLEIVTYLVSAALPLLSLLQPLLPLLLQPGLLLHLIILMATCHCILNRLSNQCSGACSHAPETTAARNVTAACSTFVIQQHISLTLTNPKYTTHLHS